MQRARRALLRFTTTCIALAAFGCGSGDVTNPGGGGADGMTAQVDGASWSANTPQSFAVAVPGVPGGYVISGTQSSSATGSRTLEINLTDIPGPGTYPLGVGSPVYGGTALFTDSRGSWETDFSGLGGSITITSLSATRVSGSFHYAAVPGNHNSNTNTISVTGGTFNLPLTGTPTPMTDKDGASLTATLNGSAYVGSTVIPIRDALGDFSITSANNQNAVTVYLNGITTPGTYPLTNTGQFHAVLVSNPAGGTSGHRPTWGLTGGDTGSIVVTSVTSTRIRGTFSVTLAPESNGSGVTGNMAASGAFDVGTP